MGKLLVAQSGGPTAAINATIAGVYLEALKHSEITEVLGARNGITGVLKEDFISLTDELRDESLIDILIQTPAAALGSCRHKMADFHIHPDEYEKIVEVLRKHNIQYFVYVGGNDSMDTVWNLSEYCKENQIADLYVMGAPKTIDNDLVGTDHCPGFGSAAKYIATTFAEIIRDCSVYETKAVTIVEVMGRNAGWLTAASALSGLNQGMGPDLVYLCEVPFDSNRFLEDIKKLHQTKNGLVVAVSEGVKDFQENYLSQCAKGGGLDAFGHCQVAGTASVLEGLVKDHIGCKVRSIELNLMQRCAGHIQSNTDIMESIELGRVACKNAVQRESGKMAAVLRLSSKPYQVQYQLIPINQVANQEKKVPLTMINEEHNHVTTEMLEYLYPLIQGERNITYEQGIPKHLIFE